MTNISIRIYSVITSAIESLKGEKGQDLIEYALISGLIAIALIGGFLLLAGDVTVLTDAIAECIDFDNVCP